MTEAIIAGISLGVTISLLAGPVFFALLQTCLLRGFISGVAFSTGILLSDTVIVSTLFYGLSSLMNVEKFTFLFSIAGGVVLITIGIHAIAKKRILNTKKTDQPVFQTSNHLKQICKGILMNTMHPGAWIFWLGVVSLVGFHTHVQKEFPVLILIMTLMTIYVIDILKSSLASYFAKYFTMRMFLYTNKIVGIILIISGCTVLVKGMHF